MAPTITSERIYSKEHLTLTNKLRKPVVEKLFRDRRLQAGADSLLPDTTTTVPASELLPVNQGYSRSVQEIGHFLSKDKMKTHPREDC
uniref:Uncharacterized protein n=1 Tax=Hucho hucho TaxID=62062 RepID=A0A4W5RWF7_9TELE